MVAKIRNFFAKPEPDVDPVANSQLVDRVAAVNALTEPRMVIYCSECGYGEMHVASERLAELAASGVKPRKDNVISPDSLMCDRCDHVTQRTA
jgi:hypothetical protein